MQQWKVIIEPKTKLFNIPIKEIFHYRSLIAMLVRRNYDTQYRQTILGSGWMFINPILSSVIYSFVYGYVGRFSSDGTPYFLFLMSGNILWNFFNQCVLSNMTIFQTNSYIFGKIYFPRLTVPIAEAIFAGVKFFFQLIAFLLVWVVYYILGLATFTGVYLIFIPILLLECAVLGTSIGMVISSLTVKYRDLTHISNFLLIALMYCAPVIYPISQVPEKIRWLILLNPISPIVEAFRYCIVGSGTIHWLYLGISVITTTVIAFVGLVVFNQVEKTSMDIV